MAVPIIEWPTGVPDCIMPLSPQGGPRDNRWSFDADSPMPPIERPMTSWAPEVYSVELVPLSIEQFQAFQTWYKVDLRQGVYPFRWFHPITRVASPWKIVKGDPPYQARKIGLIPHGSGRRRIAVSFQVMSWPGSFPPGFLEEEQGGGNLVLQEQEDRVIIADGYTFNG